MERLCVFVLFSLLLVAGISAQKWPPAIEERRFRMSANEVSEVAEALRRGNVALEISKHGLRTVDAEKSVSVSVGHGGKPSPRGPAPKPGRDVNVGVGKGGVDVNVGPGKGKPVNVGVGKGGGNVNVGPGGNGKPAKTGKAVNVGVGKGGVGVNVGHPGGKPVHVAVGNPFNYIYAAEDDMVADPSLSMFLLRKDLAPGKTVKLQLLQKVPDSDTDADSFFVPRAVADAIPFSTEQLPAAMRMLNVRPGSATAAQMERTVGECAAPAVRGERKLCATSLESMVEFAQRSLRTDGVDVLSTAVPASARPKQSYEILAVVPASASASAGGKGAVACHNVPYPYAVLYCHATAGTSAAKAVLRGEDGAHAEAVAVCHSAADTAAWNPGHVSFRVLKVKPGEQSICHFLPTDHLLWVPTAA